MVLMDRSTAPLLWCESLGDVLMLTVLVFVDFCLHESANCSILGSPSVCNVMVACPSSRIQFTNELIA